MKAIKINNLTKRNMKNIFGGEQSHCVELCVCGCVGIGPGGHTGSEWNNRNGNANMKAGKYSPGGSTLYPIEN